MDVHSVEEAVLVFGLYSAHCCHSSINSFASDNFVEQARQALCCRCGPDGKRERDDVCGKNDAVIDDRSTESRTLARGEYEQSAPVRRAQRNESRCWEILVVPR